jgi:leucyl/phenylalanyl-tRNA--protein transferase
VFVAAPPEGARLVGGIYGVSIGAAFFAESMFSLPDQGGSNASSLCLLHLWTHLRACDYALLDVQIANHHTAQFGLRQLPASDYLALLTPAVARPCAWKSPVAPARSIAPPA